MTQVSELSFDAALLHDRVCGETGLDFPIYCDINAGDWAVPNVMIALAMPHEGTSVALQFIAHFLLVLSHSKAQDPLSRWNKTT